MKKVHNSSAVPPTVMPNFSLSLIPGHHQRHAGSDLPSIALHLSQLQLGCHLCSACTSWPPQCLVCIHRTPTLQTHASYRGPCTDSHVQLRVYFLLRVEREAPEYFATPALLQGSAYEWVRRAFTLTDLSLWNVRCTGQAAEVAV